MLHRYFLRVAFISAALLCASGAIPQAQTAPAPTPPNVQSLPPASAAPILTAPPPQTAPPSATAPPPPGATPPAAATPVPILLDPPSAGVAVGATSIIHVSGVLGEVSASIANPALAEVRVDQNARLLYISGKAIGTTTITVKDERGVTRDLPLRIAYAAGTVGDGTVVHITGNPASPEFLRETAAHAAYSVAHARPGATIIATTDGIDIHAPLAQDNVADFAVPVLIQGNDFFGVQGTTRVRVYNDAAPIITPSSLMVSDFPETLTENGVLFTADLARGAPSRFLYFHYNPGTQPGRRIVLRAQNLAHEPATVQFISGQAGPGPNEMEVGHLSTQRFLQHLVQNEGALYTIAPGATVNLVEQDLPAKSIVSNILQLRLVMGTTLHLTLFAQNATEDPNAQLASEELLSSGIKHARGVYAIPEFKYEQSWSTTGSYLELPIGQIPLPNLLRGEALSGDYGVKQSFVIKVQNPTRTPQAIAIYEDPRGGRATGTFLIDNVLVQSHGVPAFSRYKLRQYTVPAKGFLRVVIETMPEAGSSYPLRLEFAPDDGSVAPGAPGSPVY